MGTAGAATLARAAGPAPAARPSVRFEPLQSLKNQIVAIDAAMLVAASGAEVGAVHKLRTSTRRVEAQLALLEALGGGAKPFPLPAHRKEAATVVQRLRKVRRASGVVRDLDVQADSIEYDAPAKTEVHKGTPGDEMRRQAKRLRRHLLKQRDVEAEKLVGVLQAEEAKLAASLRALEQTLKPAGHGHVSQNVLVERVEHWFSVQAKPLLRRRSRKQAAGEAKDPLRQAIETMSEADLHTVRKAAKLCRYMAEATPEGSPARRMAERFESIQEAGGRWHDWLLLQQLSAGFHGKKAALTQRYAKHCESALAEYHLRLAELVPTVSPAKRAAAR